MNNSSRGFRNRTANLPVQVQILLPLSPGVLTWTGKCQIHKRTNQTYEGQQHMHLLSKCPCKQ